jgi:hypothetical protein
MQNTITYLEETLGVEIIINTLKEVQLKNLPLFIRQLYNFYQVQLFGRNLIFLEGKSREPATVSNLKKHANAIERVLDCPVVFIFPFLQAYNRKRLIQKQVGFIVPGKQMFIPRLFIDFREFGYSVTAGKEKLLPAAQCILFYHMLIENLEIWPLKTIAKKVNYTTATITRAVQALIDKGIADKTILNKEVRIRFRGNNDDLWKKALPVLQNPIKKIYVLEEASNQDILYQSSYNALTTYTNLTENKKKFYAIAANDFQVLKMNKDIRIVRANEGEMHLEVWKYDPGILTHTRIIDPLSLYLTLIDEKDERIEMELEKMIASLW